MKNSIEALASLLDQAQSLAAFTGAGFSTESGIPDYRSPDGLWARHKPPMLNEFMSSGEARARYWRFYQELLPPFQSAQPNPGHLALGRLHRAGRLKGVITQNIDGLHMDGGVSPEDVLELHGNLFNSACLACKGNQRPTTDYLKEFAASGQPPVCPTCGGAVKPCTISFGQGLDGAVLQRAAEMCAGADLLLTMGSSLSVTPAAELPGLTLSNGGRLAIINQSPTHLDEAAALVVDAPAGATLSAAVELLLGSGD